MEGSIFPGIAAAMGLWLLISCVFGAVVLYVVSVQAAVQERCALRRLRQRVAELERAQAQVRIPSGFLQAFPDNASVGKRKCRSRVSFASVGEMGERYQSLWIW